MSFDNPEIERSVIPVSLARVNEVEMDPSRFIPGFEAGVTSYIIVRPTIIGRGIARLLRRDPKAYIHPAGPQR